MAFQPELSQIHYRMRRMASILCKLWERRVPPLTLILWRSGVSLMDALTCHTGEPLGLKRGSVGNTAWPAAFHSRTSYLEGLLS